MKTNAKSILLIALAMIGVGACLIFAFVVIRIDLQPHFPCQDKTLQNDAAIECYGVISVDGFGEDGFDYYITDNLHSYTIASIRKFSDFRLINGRVYVIDQEGWSGLNKITNKYGYSYFVDNQMRHYSSTTKEGMPRFFIIDTISGNVSPYISIDQVPESEKPIFQELEKK